MKISKSPLYFIALIVLILLSGCASVWLTCHTGKRVYFQKGTERSEVTNLLGEPNQKITTAENQRLLELRYTVGGISSNELSYIDVYDYKGKINSIDEGSGQAMLNAITLGTGEIIALPITVVSTVARSFGDHKIFIFYDFKDKLLAVLVDSKNN